MLIKRADDKTEFLKALEEQALGAGPQARQASTDLERWRVGISGEKDAAYLIDFDYDKSRPDWAVIHDLRLEHGGRVAQIDHLMINRLLEIFVLETKNYNCDLKVNERGEFTAFYGRRGYGIPSPLEQNERHIAVLKDVCATLDLPDRMGIRMMPSFESYVLVSTAARLTLPKGKSDFCRVIKADQLKRTLAKRIDDMPVLTVLSKAARMVSQDTVHSLAKQLVARHRPLATRSADVAKGSQSQEATKKAVAPIAKNAVMPIATTPLRTCDGPACKNCKGTRGQVLYGKYGYYFKCAGCDSNTSIRFTCKPGHHPRLRKEGDAFFRDCPKCGTSEGYHVNAPQ